METPSESEDEFGEMPTRSMRVKVLYTFDADSKVTCLARFSETLQIPVVQIDEHSYVGVIALHKCLQSIAAASPELMSKPANNDFAVYAYDYSEHETPLVGQGMLSAALAAASMDVRAAGPMITGRVCQNVPAVFSNGVKETLEVKLRLTPVVSTRVEMKSLDIHRTSTPATSAGFDPNTWNHTMQQMRPLQSMDEIFNFDLGTGDDQDLMDEILGLGTSGGHQDVGVAGTPTDSMFAGQHPAFASHSHSAPGSRVGTPNVSSDASSRNKLLRHQSFSVNTQTAEQCRPGSRASSRSEYHPQQHGGDSEHGSPAYEEFQDEDGQARKRAKITQTDWRGKSSFGGRSSDLRVTAATAASMQMYRPVPTRAYAPGSNLEPPPRVPTPVPRGATGLHRPSRPSLGSKSLLRQASTAASEFMSDTDQMSEAIASSPEDISPDASNNGTPQEIPSSPPVYQGLLLPQTGSPRQSAFADSGYMSERNPEHFRNDSESCSPDFQPGLDLISRPFIKREESSMSELPQSYMLPMSDVGYEVDLPGAAAGEYFPVASGKQVQRNIPTQQAYSQMSSRANSPLPNLAPAQSRGARLNNSARRSSLVLPQISQSDISRPPTQLQRSRSQYESEAGSPAPSEPSGRPTGPGRSGSGAPRRRIIEQRLHTAVAKGEMPQFCSHCGAIETPTWRRLYVKYVDGKPSPLDFVEGEGETIGVEELEYDDETGEVTKFVIRKSMKKTKDFQPGKGFVDTQICNSCGLWFTKMRNMRPQNKWGRKSGTRRSRKNKAPGEMTDGMEPPSEAFYTDAVGPDDGNDTTAESQRQQADNNTAMPLDESQQSRRSSECLQRQSSREERASNSMNRSSPVRIEGTQQSPIELDGKTPKPTRRLLFPSPRQEGVTKTLENGNVFTTSATEEDWAEKLVSADNTDMTVFGAFQVDKENMPPTDDEDEFSHLLAGSPSALFKTPQKSALRRSPRTNKLYGSPFLASPIPSSRKRKANSGDRQHQDKPASNDFMTSPASSRYFLRSTPTRLAATPGRRSQNNDHQRAHDVSPFSRQLVDMLNNDTGVVFSTPSQAFAFADLPNLTSPSGQHIDWDQLDVMMGSDYAELEDMQAPADEAAT